MIYPYERYLTTLLVKGYDTATICRKLSTFSLIPPTNEEIDEKRASVFETLPAAVVEHIFPPERADYVSLIAAHRDSLAVLDIEEMIPILLGQRSKEWEDVVYILADEKIRTALQTLTLFGMPSLQVTDTVAARYGMVISQEVYALFTRYIWDTPRMTKLELYTYISNLDGVANRRNFLDAFRKREETIRWRFTGESIVNLESILKEVMNEAFFKFRDSMRNEEPDNVHRVSKWADLAIKAAEKFDKIFKSANNSLLSAMVVELEKKRHDDIVKKDDVKEDII